jgi:hypothetical protein
MPVFCYEKWDLERPVCGVHKVQLKQDRIPIDSNAPWLGRIHCFLCPVSQMVVDERRVRHASTQR